MVTPTYITTEQAAEKHGENFLQGLPPENRRTQKARKPKLSRRSTPVLKPQPPKEMTISASFQALPSQGL
jgi:hypothetical protein